MWWPFQWLLIYVLGGLTFVPLVIALGYVYKYGSVPIGDDDPSKLVDKELQAKSERDELLDQEDGKAKGRSLSSAKPLSGWLTVRRQFAPAVQSSSIFTPNTSNATIHSEPVPIEVDDAASEKDDASIESGISTPTTNTPTVASAAPSSTNAATMTTNGQPTTYSARIAQTYRQMMEARARKEAPAKEYFFCVLKGRVLFMYEDETQSECVAAVGIDKYVVRMETKEGGRFSGKDAEMFAKRNALVLRMQEKTDGGKTGLPALMKGMNGSEDTEDDKEVESAPWYIFTKSNTKMEDWYLALTSASALNPTIDAVFSEGDMQALVNTIDTEPDPIPMRWFNAMLGRIFFGVYRTEALEQFIIGKIMKKLSKVPRPSFLGPIVIREVNVGTFPPIFSKPMLKDLTAEGTASFEVHMNYRSRPTQPNSQVRVTIATSATIPTGFKPYVVNLVLAVVLKSIEGNMVMQIKKPPSNRIWYGFTQMPKLEVEILPVVSERKIQIGMVLKAIEKQLREVIADSIVLPNMDDIAFFDTSAQRIRGGIFSSAGKVVNGPTADVPSGGAGEALQATQPGVEVGTSADDRVSVTAETPGLRKRRTTKSQTVDTQGKAGVSAGESDGEQPIPRLDTAPAHLSSLSDSIKAPSRQSTKRWFASNGRPPSIGSLSALAHPDASKESIDKMLLSSGESSSAKPPSTASAPTVSHGFVPVTADRAHRKAESIGDRQSIRSVGRTSIDSIDTESTLITGEGGKSASPTQSTASTASLMNSIRARDKKAIMTQANTARDAVKKWGVNWAAKRRNLTVDDDKPPPLYRPPDDDVDVSSRSTPSLSRSAEAPKSLQERLNAAAAAAAAGRPKSSDSTSESPSKIATGRPTLQSSPSKTSVSKFASSPPPQWTLSTGAPTIEVNKGEASVKPSLDARPTPKAESSNGSFKSTQSAQAAATTGPSERRLPHSSPVFTQPTAGRSMVVPRMPKRPGEIIGIGSSEAGITRRISGGQEDTGIMRPPNRDPEANRGEQDSKVLPPLPSRKPIHSDRPEPSLVDPAPAAEDGYATLGSGQSQPSSFPLESEPITRPDSAPAATVGPPQLPERPQTEKDEDIGPGDDTSASHGEEPVLSAQNETVTIAQTVALPPSETPSPDSDLASPTGSWHDEGSAAGILRNVQQRDERGRAASIGSSRDL